jgi:nucleoid DNA-binding protein
MATLIEAVRQYGPKVKRNNTVQLEQLANWVAMRTSLNKSEVAMTLAELNEAILFFNCQGTPVKLPGLGTFAPSIDRHGNYRINVRTDQALVKGINSAQAFTGAVDNRGNIGLSNEALKERWDTEHPADPLEL